LAARSGAKEIAESHCSQEEIVSRVCTYCYSEAGGRKKKEEDIRDFVPRGSGAVLGRREVPGQKYEE